MLAYFHTTSLDFIPCKILARVPKRAAAMPMDADYGGPLAVIRVTADRGPFKRGDELLEPQGALVKRPLYRSRGSRRLYGYTFAPDELAHLPERT